MRKSILAFILIILPAFVAWAESSNPITRDDPHGRERGENHEPRSPSDPAALPQHNL